MQVIGALGLVAFIHSTLNPKLSEGSLPSSDRPRTLAEGSQPERMSERAGRGEVRVKPHLLDQYRPTHKPCSPLREHSLGAGHTGPPL